MYRTVYFLTTMLSVLSSTSPVLLIPLITNVYSWPLLHEASTTIWFFWGSAAATPIPLRQSSAVNNMANKRDTRLNPSPPPNHIDIPIGDCNAPERALHKKSDRLQSVAVPSGGGLNIYTPQPL